MYVGNIFYIAHHERKIFAKTVLFIACRDIWQDDSAVYIRFSKVC